MSLTSSCAINGTQRGLTICFSDDVPMSKVKFNVTAEYAYIQNFKVLQSTAFFLPSLAFDLPPQAAHAITNGRPPPDTFSRHQVDHPIPVQALIKCKMQDNLEFLQWTKRYWDQYFPGHEYDAVARRKASGAPASSVGSGTASPLRTSTATRTTTAPRRPVPVSNTAAPRAAARTGSAAGGGTASVALASQVAELSQRVTDLERERDFYFNKLREIEVLLQAEVEAKPELEGQGGLVHNVQQILYSTEEGFEIPAEDGEEGEDGVAGAHAHEVAPGEEETF